MVSLTIARTDQDWPPVIAVEGVLNTRTVGPCMDRIAERVQGPVVLDLSGVYVCDPAGVSALVDLGTKIVERGGRCIVAAPSYPVARALRTTGAARLMSVCATVELARQRLLDEAVRTER